MVSVCRRYTHVCEVFACSCVFCGHVFVEPRCCIGVCGGDVYCAPVPQWCGVCACTLCRCVLAVSGCVSTCLRTHVCVAVLCNSVSGDASCCWALKKAAVDLGAMPGRSVEPHPCRFSSYISRSQASPFISNNHVVFTLRLLI